MYSYDIDSEGRYLLHLLGCVINGSQPAELPGGLDFGKVFALAEKHSVGAMSFAAVKKLKNRPEGTVFEQWSELSDKEFCRDIIQKSEYGSICRELTGRGVRLLPLKGILIKELYPRSFMRTMSDIDLLIDPENAGTVREVMISLGFSVRSFGVGNDDRYEKPPVMNVEVHRQLFAEENMEGLSARHFCDPWQHTRSTGSGVSEMSVSFFFGYVLAHAAKHYSDMGTGIKHFMDIYLIYRRYSRLIDLTVLDKLMSRENAGLCREMLRLAEQWFGEGQPDGSLDAMEAFVLGSGTYGTWQNSLDRKLVEMGRLGYLRYELFIPADRIIYDYPVLKEKPWLLPAVRMKRLFDKTVGDPELLKMNLRSLFRR